MSAREKHISHEREAAIIGCILFAPDQVWEVRKYLSPSGAEFTDMKHRLIWRAMATLANQRKEIGPFNIAELLKKDGAAVGADGGFAYLIELMERHPFTRLIAASNAKELRESHIKRQLGDTLQQAADICRAGGELEEAAPLILESLLLTTHRADAATERGYADIRLPLERLIAERAESAANGRPASGITSGIHNLDNLTGGFHPGELVVKGGRPASGKTNLAGQMGLAQARAGVPVWFGSLEMSADSLSERLIVNIAGLHAGKVRTGAYSDYAQQAYYFHELQRAGDELAALPFWIYDRNGTLDQIIAAMYVGFQKRGCRVFYIDYAQRLNASSGERTTPKHERIENAARRFKTFAQETKSSVVLLAQLNRGMENEKRRPTLADLKDSGGLEQEADVVILLYAPKDSGGLTLELDVAKNRHGSNAVIEMQFNPVCLRLTEGESQ